MWERRSHTSCFSTTPLSIVKYKLRGRQMPRKTSFSATTASTIFCFAGAICVANPDYSFNCSCPTGYTGAHCEHVVGSPCIEEPCLHGGKCFVVRNNVTENLHFRNSTTASNAKVKAKCRSPLCPTLRYEMLGE